MYSLTHIGINTKNNEEAQKLFEVLSFLFDFDRRKETDEHVFAGPNIEIMKHDRLGKNGHIGIHADDVPKAMEELAKKGIEFDPNTFRYDENGKIKFAYFKNDICNFAFHLTTN